LIGDDNIGHLGGGERKEGGGWDGGDLGGGSGSGSTTATAIIPA